MNIIEFNWTSMPELEQKDYVEKELFEIIQDHRDDLWPCHPDDIVISLGITGPLNERLKGVANCKKCKKNIMEFEGDDRASNLKITIFRN